MGFLDRRPHLPDRTRWLRTATPIQQRAHLGRRHIYILPTRHGLLLGMVLLAMLIGAINYTLSLGFVLTFLLAGLGIVGMLHTWRNLAYLSLSPGKFDPVFAGEPTHWQVFLADHDSRARYAIGLRHDKKESVYVDIAAGQRAQVMITFATQQRGWLVPDRLTVSTEFPLGLFHAWSYVRLDARGLVYPSPAPSGHALPVTPASDGNGQRRREEGDDDFSGLRAYRPGDSPRRIDWKASSREQGLLSKQFEDTAPDSLWLNWELAAGDTEQRLSQLTRWLLDARDSGQPYGLRLPGTEIPPAHGEAHDRRCLEALALFRA